MLKSFRNSTSKNLRPVIQSRIACNSTKYDRRKRMLRTRTEQKSLYGSVIQDEISNNKVPDSETDKSQSCKESFEFDSNMKPDVASVSNKYHSRKKVLQSVIRDEYANGEASNSKSFIKFQSDEESYDLNDLKIVSPAVASELYWLVKSSTASKNVRIFKSTQANKDVLPRKPCAIISAKNLLQQFMINRRATVKQKTPQIIPFNESELKSIVNYPLVCEKSHLSGIKEIIAETSLQLPSISKVLQATMSDSARIALKNWKMNKIRELGFDGFKEYGKETMGRGKNFHLAIEQFLNIGNVPERSSPIIKLWDSIDVSLQNLKPKSVLSEQPIFHAALKYKGIIDNVSLVKDELCAFEWKTSEKAKPRLTSTYDAPVQLCAYLGALNADPRYDLTVKSGYVIVAYTNGTPANVFNLSEADLRKYWLMWLQRLQEYWIRTRDGTLPAPFSM